MDKILDKTSLNPQQNQHEESKEKPEVRLNKPGALQGNRYNPQQGFTSTKPMEDIKEQDSE